MKIIFALLFGATLFFAQGAVVKAGVNDFVINDFNADYVLDNNVPGGSLETTETIKLTFSDQNHGILRAIPGSYQGNSTKLKVQSVQLDGTNEQYTTYSENGNTVLKIGNPDKTITGPHTYKIAYHQERIVNFVDEEPQFYWDVNGNDWLQPFEKVSATLRYKNGPIKDDYAGCFTGRQGSTAQDCEITYKDGTLVFATTKPLFAGENLTVASTLTGINFVKPTWKDKLQDNIHNIVGIASGLILAVGALIIWMRYGKDYAGKGTIVPEYQPPKDLTPAEVGMLADYKVDSRDLSATLIDLAVRGYLKLHEEKSKVLFFTTRSYSVEVVKDATKGMKAHERALLDGMFGTASVGQSVELSSLDKTKMSAAVQSARAGLKDSLVKSYGLIESKTYSLAIWMYVLAGALFVGTFFSVAFGWGFIVGGAIAGLAFLIAGIFMPRRSHAGQDIYEKILGLKMYMNVAEKDRLKMMQSVDRPYAEPSKTVELFEKLLPYAVALGVEKSWAKQFDGILTESPSWIDSNSTAAFSGAYLASSISGVATSFGSSFESSSGASSGGGSSGGGGGGGGGGGW